jgi:hypothetical protein
MPSLANEARKKIIVARILNTVAQYFKAHGEPIRMQILSAKFARALEDLGGFPETMQQLETDGEVRIEISKTGAQLIYPKLEENAQKVWF